MVLQQIELINIKQFADRKFLFQTGWNEITLGNLGGKSTLIEAVQTVFKMESAPSAFFKQHTEESSVKLDFLLGGNIFSVQKRWRHSRLIGWSVESQNTQYDLLRTEERIQWMKSFMTLNLKGRASDIPEELVDSQYHFLIQCLYQPAAGFLEKLTEQKFADELFGLSAYETIAEKLSRLESSASEDLQSLKLHEQKLVQDRRALDQRRRDSDKLEQEIRRIETLIRQLQEHQEQLRAEQSQAERINEYIAERKKEIENIESQLQGHNAKLNEGARDHYSENEINELNSKRQRYEDLARQVTNLEQGIIERSHLEKNLAGLQHEIQKLTTQKQLVSIPTAGEHNGAAAGQVALYEAEAERIRILLAGKSGLEEEAEKLRQEKQAFQAANERYLTLTSSRQFMTPKDSLEIQSLMERLEEQKNRSLKDLDALEASVHEEHYRTRQNILQQTHQQIAEQKMKLEELNRRKISLSKTSGNVGSAKSGATDMEENIRKQITLKRYLAFARDTVIYLKQTAAEKVKTEFIESLNRHAGSTPWPNEFIRLISISNDPDKTAQAAALKRFSDTEKIRFSAWLHLSTIRFFTSLDCAILDEHLAWMFDHEDLNQIYSTVDKMSLEQIIFFQRIPFS